MTEKWGEKGKGKEKKEKKRKRYKWINSNNCSISVGIVPMNELDWRNLVSNEEREEK